MDPMLVAARALALAAIDVLTAACVEVPAYVAIDVKEGDWIPRGEGCQGCAQIVVTPATRVVLADNDNGTGASFDRCATRLTVEYRLQVGWCVSEELDQPYGHIELGPDALANEGTAWEEAGHIVATRSALARDLPGYWTQRLCECLGPSRRGVLVESLNWAEGACAGSDMRLEVSL